MSLGSRAAGDRTCPAPLARFEPAIGFESSSRARRSLGHVRRFLAMIHELHKLGYQGIRISPGWSPAGIHWRCSVAATPNIGPDGWSLIDYCEGAHYSSAAGARFFEWEDAPRKSPRQLAQMFIERFPRLASASIGMDYAYAGWIVALLGAVEHGRLPAFHADYELDLSRLDLPPSPPKQWPSSRKRLAGPQNAPVPSRTAR